MRNAIEVAVPSETHERAILRGIAWVMLFVLVGKVVGALKEMAIAWRFGVSATTDAYLFVFNVVNWPVGIWSSIVPSVVLPLMARLRATSVSELRTFQSQLLGLTIGLGVVLGAVAVAALPGILESEWLRLDASVRALAVSMVPALSLMLPLGMAIALYSAWTMSEGRHTNTLLEGAPAAGILVALLLAGSAAALIWGTVIGMLAQLGLLLLAFGGKGLTVPSFSLSSPQWHLFRQGFMVLFLAQLLMSFTAIIDQFFAARFGDGAISTFGYANRVLGLVLSLGATAVTRATLPVFSRLSADVGPSSMGYSAVGRWAMFAWLAGAIALGAGWPLAPTIVGLLFERGNFTLEHTIAVSEVLRYGLLQLPFYLAAMVLTSATASRSKYGVLLVTGVSALLIKVLVNLALAEAMAVNALMISAAAVYIVNMCILIGMWKSAWKN